MSKYRPYVSVMGLYRLPITLGQTFRDNPLDFYTVYTNHPLCNQEQGINLVGGMILRILGLVLGISFMALIIMVQEAPVSENSKLKVYKSTSARGSSRCGTLTRTEQICVAVAGPAT